MPVITTTANGFCELWPDIEGSVVTAPDDPELQDACDEWLDPERRAIARVRNRATGGLHSVAQNVGRTLECFQKLIEQG